MFPETDSMTDANINELLNDVEFYRFNAISKNEPSNEEK